MGMGGVYAIQGDSAIRVRLGPLDAAFAVVVFFADYYAHWFLEDFAFHPRYEVEVGEGACFEAVAFELADLFEEFFEFCAHGMAGDLEGAAEEAEHFFFYFGEAFSSGHEAVD